MPNISNGESGSSIRSKFNDNGLPKNNLTAIANPVVGDDTLDGYETGSRWINVTSDEEFVCLDASAGAAVWLSTTGGGSGGLDSSQVINLLQPNIDSNALDIATEVNSRSAADSNLQAQIDSNEAFFKTRINEDSDARIMSDSNLNARIDSNEALAVVSDISLVANSIKVNNLVIIDSDDYVALGSYDSNTAYYITTP